MRKPRLLLAVAASMSVAFAVAPAANADDPAQDKAVVEQQIAEARGELLESTAAVAAAVTALERVDSQLAAARESLTAAKAQLDAATLEDQRLAADLSAAKSEERAAEAALVELQATIEHDRDILSGLARTAYQGGQLSQVSALLESESFGDYTERSEGLRSVIRAQSALVDALADDRAQQSTTQATLEDVRERVTVARAAAAANLVEKVRLEQEAAAAEAEIERLQAERATVLADAQSMLAADEAEYRALEIERTRLETLLAERAAAQAAAAQAAAQSGASSDSAPSYSDAGGPLYRPVSGWVTSPYGWRVHPISGIRKFHDGTDFGSGCGTPIHAAASGTVLSTYYAGGYGNQTVIEHGSVNGQYLATSYNHQSGFAVSAGQHVDRGQVIGYVGTTGYSTGCHLHFIVYVNGATTDPMNYL